MYRSRGPCPIRFALQQVEPFLRGAWRGCQRADGLQIRYLGGMSLSNMQSETMRQILAFVHKFRPEAEEIHRTHGINTRCISGLIYCRTIASVRFIA